MNWTALVSISTAFVLGFGGSIGVVLVATKGSMPDAPTWIAALVLGATTAAKDLRSLFKLPPINGSSTPERPTK